MPIFCVLVKLKRKVENWLKDIRELLLMTLIAKLLSGVTKQSSQGRTINIWNNPIMLLCCTAYTKSSQFHYMRWREHKMTVPTGRPICCSWVPLPRIWRLLLPCALAGVTPHSRQEGGECVGRLEAVPMKRQAPLHVGELQEALCLSESQFFPRFPLRHHPLLRVVPVRHYWFLHFIDPFVDPLIPLAPKDNEEYYCHWGCWDTKYHFNNNFVENKYVE